METLPEELGGFSSEEKEKLEGLWGGLGGGLEVRSCMNMTIEIMEEFKEEVYMAHGPWPMAHSHMVRSCMNMTIEIMEELKEVYMAHI